MRNFQSRLILGLGGLALTACSGGGSSSKSSSISIQIPEVKSSGVRAESAYDFSKACFAINVKGSDISLQASSGKCDVPIGLFSGFVASGGTLTLTVPHGTGRSLEVFTYLRDTASAACPTSANLGTMARNKLVRVGSVANFDTIDPTVILDVTLTTPAATDNLVSQYSLPNSCTIVQAAAASAGITLGHQRISGGNYVIEAALSSQKNDVSLSGGQYKIQLMRSSQ